MSNKVSICGIDTSTLPKATNNEIIELIKKAHKGDKDARETCIYYNMRLVLSIVQRFPLQASAVDDVFQVGMVGLIKAIDNFDTSIGVQFSTYAVPMIIGEIKRFQRDRTSIKVSRSLRDIAYKALQAKEDIEKNSNEEATILEIAKKIDVAPHKVSNSLSAIMDPISIFENVFGEGDESLQLLDQINDKSSSEDIWIEKTVLNEGIKRLNPKEQNIVMLRYFVGKTQTEISEEIGISQAQVSRLEKEAIKHIKSYLN